mgnify:CR=1 FL=1
MPLRFFNNIINSQIDTVPDKMYRNLQQEFIDMQWDNTTALYTVKEQRDIGSCCYDDLEVWLVPTVADTSTGLKDVRDFNKLIFRDITHTVKRGLMYKFDNCYWIVHSYSEYDGVVQDCGIRRCNNSLKIKDPKNGAIFSIPCVVDYDMAASTVKVSKYILTPNNHAVIMVQGNEDTLRLFKTNTRFILSGRPFKLYGYQNAVDYDIDSPTTLLYLDLYLDEFRDGDDLELGIAENGTYNYDIFINSKDEILLVCSHNNYYFVGGHVEENESDKDCLLREIKEETGVVLKDIYEDLFYTVEYLCKDYPERNINSQYITNYYVINMDLVADKENINLTENEKDGDFELIWINKNDILSVLNIALESSSNKNVTRDTISVIEEYLKYHLTF